MVIRVADRKVLPVCPRWRAFTLQLEFWTVIVSEKVMERDRRRTG